MLRSLVLGIVVLYGYMLAASGHETPHQYMKISNGAIEYGREPGAGGCITWLSENGGPNLINNLDFGRQCQVAVFDTMYWNPLQAGDGANPAITEFFVVQPEYIYSRCIPPLCQFTPYLLSIPFFPPQFDKSQQIDMWSEFLPNAGGRAIWVRTLWQNWGDRKANGRCQVMSPTTVTNRVFSKSVGYTGTKPWTGEAATDYVDDNPHDMASTYYLATELWQALVDENNYGVSAMGRNADVVFMDFEVNDGSQGDHTWSCQEISPLDFFIVGRNPGETVQMREGGIILYLGDVTEARDFFQNYRPILGPDMTDNFDDGDFLGWSANSCPIEVVKGAVKIGPFTGYPQDLSKLNRYYGDATYSVRLKLDGQSGWCGIAIRKPDDLHFWGTVQHGYVIGLSHDGEVSVMAEGKPLASGKVPDFDPDDWHTLTIQAQEFDIGVTVDGVQAIVFVDDLKRCREGYVSLAASDGSTAWFDDFCISGSQGDAQPPAGVTGFSLETTASSDSLHLAWTNPKDDDWRFTRIVRKESKPPSNPYDGFPCYEGKLASYLDVGLEPDKKYYYAAYAGDHAGNYAVSADVTGKPGTNARVVKKLREDDEGGVIVCTVENIPEIPNKGLSLVQVMALEGKDDVPQPGTEEWKSVKPRIRSQAVVEEDGKACMTGLNPGTFTIVAIFVPPIQSSKAQEITNTVKMCSTIVTIDNMKQHAQAVLRF